VNYYPHHIGDFNAGTVRMSQLERWIYRDMIEVYYDTEQPLPADVAAVCKKIGARGDEQRSIVAELLADKFTLEDDGHHHARCDEEIAEYHAKADTARQNGKKGGRPKKPNPNPEKPSGFLSGSDSVRLANPDETGSQANQEPITNNQEPVTKEKNTARSSIARASRFDARAWLTERGVDEQLASDWLTVRKAGGGANTLTAFEAQAKEAEKAGISLVDAVRFCATQPRPWVGFKADWYAERMQGRQSSLDLARQVQQKAGSKSSGNTTPKSRFDLKSTEYDGPTDAPFDF
jgi:uncharacterized protein YdaU (DUF1376 family)